MVIGYDIPIYSSQSNSSREFIRRIQRQCGGDVEYLGGSNDNVGDQWNRIEERGIMFDNNFSLNSLINNNHLSTHI